MLIVYLSYPSVCDEQVARVVVTERLFVSLKAGVIARRVVDQHDVQHARWRAG